MTEGDAMSARFLGHPTHAPVPMLAGVYEGTPDRKQVLDKARALPRLLPQFARTIERTPWTTAAPRWNDAHVVPEAHVEWIDLPGGSIDDVLRWAEREHRSPIPVDRPHWKLIVIDRLAGGRSVVALRFHHSLMDGGGAVALFEQWYDDSPDSRPVPPPVTFADAEPTLPTARARYAEAWGSEAERLAHVAGALGTRAVHSVRDPAWARRRAGAWRASLGRLARSAGTAPMSDLFAERDATYTPNIGIHRFDLAEFKAGARSAGGSVNDGFLAALAIGAERYHRRHGSTATAIRAAVAVDVRSSGDEGGGNHVGGIVLPLPMDGSSLASRIAAIGPEVRSRRDDAPALWVAARVPQVMTRLPKALLWKPQKRSPGGLDLVTSNVPGVPWPHWFAGCRHEFTFAVANRNGGSIGAAFTSWGGRVTVSFNIDPVAVADPDELRADLRTALDEVLANAPAGETA